LGNSQFLFNQPNASNIAINNGSDLFGNSNNQNKGSVFDLNSSKNGQSGSGLFSNIPNNLFIVSNFTINKFSLILFFIFFMQFPL